MKRLVIQVNIKPKPKYDLHTTSFKDEGEKQQYREAGKTFYRKDDLYALAVIKARAYAERCGAEYLEITEQIPELEGFTPAWAKFKLYELFEKNPELENLMCVDGDCIMADDAPNIFDFASEGFWAPENSQNGSYSNYITAPKKMSIWKRSGIPFTHRQCSTGLMVMDRGFYEATRDHWLALCKTVGSWKFSEHDQEVFNSLVYHHYRDGYKLLSQDWGGPFKIGRWGLHYTCTLTADWKEEVYLKDMEKFSKRKPADKHPVNEVKITSFSPYIVHQALDGTLNKEWFMSKENCQIARDQQKGMPMYFHELSPLKNMVGLYKPY